MENPKDRHTLGGVFSIVSGVLGILAAIGIIIFIIFFGIMINAEFEDIYSMEMEDEFFTMMFVIYGVMGFLYIVLGILAIIGGAFSLQKKHWGFAMAGAIAASMVFYPCGIAATVFVALAKPEFIVPRPQPVELPAGY